MTGAQINAQKRDKRCRRRQIARKRKLEKETDIEREKYR